MTAVPSLRVERAILREHGGVLACIDEVGRGALAGPVSVGIVLVDLSTKSAPSGVRDSKLVPEPKREALAARVRRWALDFEVAHASNDEIDALGIIAALRVAGRRALDALAARDVVATHVLLDGKHDWLAPPRLSLFDDDDGWLAPPVTMRIKADMTCAAVAGASILAKVERDAIMRAHAVDYPAYGWDGNKGYAAIEHRVALRELGPTPLHRISWKLGLDAPVTDIETSDDLDDLGETATFDASS